MKSKPIGVRQKVKVLRDPRPVFVSLVHAGANMTPFKVLKADKAVKQDGFAVAEVRFDREAFPVEADVKRWLEEGGYDSYILAAEERFFVARSKASFDGAMLQTLPLDRAVTLVVADLRKDHAAVHEPAAPVVSIAKEDGMDPETQKEPAEALPAEGTAEQAEMEPHAEAPAVPEEVQAAKAEEPAPVDEPAPAEEPAQKGVPLSMALQLADIVNFLGYMATDVDGLGLDPAIGETLRSSARRMLRAIRALAESDVESLRAWLESLAQKEAFTGEIPEEAAKTEAVPVETLVGKLEAKLDEALSGIAELKQKMAHATTAAVLPVAKGASAEEAASEAVVESSSQPKDDDSEWLRQRTLRSVFGTPVR